MLRALPHLLGFVLPVAVVYGLRLGGVWTFLPVALLLVVIPILDALSGLDFSTPSHDEEWFRNPCFRLVTWAWVLVQPALLLWTLNRVAAGMLSGLEPTGLTLSVGMTTGTIRMTFAPELVHRSERLERALGEILLATTSDPQFAIEHVYGHHRHVSAPRDPATARFGESLYAFVPRSVLGSTRSAARFEIERLCKRGHTALFLLALVPPLWRRTMDQRVIEWRMHHLSHPEHL